MSFLAGFIHRQFLYEPPVPTASFKDKTVIITGSNVGLGLEAARWIVRLDASLVILAVRNLEKGKAAAEDIRESTKCRPETLQVWHLDMASYASIKSFAERAKSLPRLDVLLGNAGITTFKFAILEEDESVITVNVVGLFLLGFLLFPKLRETAERYGTQTHFTVTSSELYAVAKFKERQAPDGRIFEWLRDPKRASMMDRYNTSKLLGIFAIKSMAALAAVEKSGVIVNCVAPGYVYATRILLQPFSLYLLLFIHLHFLCIDFVDRS
jgi:NAD(P)-dependent dehydrogenase (short-subunit alcohol dehydrogenase family)